MSASLIQSRRSLWQAAIVAAIGLLSAAALSLAPPSACAQADPSAFDAAFAQFQRASNGDDAAADDAATRFAALSQAEPTDPVLMAYAGAARSMRARGALLPWNKMSLAEDGLAQIDKALALLTPADDQPLHRGTPASLETRFVAASTFLALPSMFNRQPRGAQLLDEVLTSPQFDASPLPFRGAVWMRAAAEAARSHRNDEARRWYVEVIRQGAPQGPAAQARLKELS
jgi:hypothetical protein